MNLEEKANLLFNNVSGWETKTLERIGKRIKKYGRLSLADIKSINNVVVVKGDLDLIIKDLAKVTNYNISQLKDMYGTLLAEQHLQNKPLYDYRGVKFLPYEENKTIQSIVNAYAKSTGETMINLAKTKALCIMGANGKPIGMQKYYTDVLDKAVMQVTTGATDFHTAMRDSIIELGGSGVRVDYGVGVTRRLDTAVRQNLLWGAKQASTEYNTMIGEELGCDGIEVDWHSNPRPSHAFMQGKQYVLGKARTINGIHFESADEALERLQDYGCLHYKTPIICGISEPRYSAEELKRLNEQNAKRYTIDGKEYSGYEITQMQRRLESSVRNEKTTRDLAKASGDNALVKRCNERIKAYQGKYNEICEITGIQGDKKRMSIPRGTASVKSATPTPKKVEVPKPITEEMKQTFKDYTNGKYDYYCEYSQALVSKTGKDLQEAIERVDKYEGSAYYIQDIGVDEAKRRTKEMMDIIDSQPETETPLYRIDRWNFDKKEGDIIEWGIHSTSRDAGFADRVLGGNEEGFVEYAERLQSRPTVFEIVGKKKHLDISEFSDFDQQESLVFGKFRIKSITEPDLSLSIKKQGFDDAVKEFPDSFEFFTSKKGKEMVRFADGKTFTIEQARQRTFYNGTYEDWSVISRYEEEAKGLATRPRKVQIEQIFE